MTRDGFYSAVAADGAPGSVVVRARDREALVRLVNRHVLPTLPLTGARAPIESTPIESTPRRDYPYRVRLPRAVWRDVLARLEADIAYPNFKEEIRRTRGETYHSVMNDVWLVLRSLTPRQGRRSMPRGG